MVSEKRLYTPWAVEAGSSGSSSGLTIDSGIIGPKFILNTLHRNLAEQGYNEVNTHTTHTIQASLICVAEHVLRCSIVFVHCLLFGYALKCYCIYRLSIVLPCLCFTSA